MKRAWRWCANRVQRSWWRTKARWSGRRFMCVSSGNETRWWFTWIKSYDEATGTVTLGDNGPAAASQSCAFTLEDGR